MIVTPVARIRRFAMTVLISVAAISAAHTAWATPQQDIIAGYAAQAKSQDSRFAGFSATRGGTFFSAHPGGGKPETPSCTTCHTASPLNVGHTRAGKEIAPMALSKTPDRYTDKKKIEKWFRRNCNTVLGRACTAQEKGDYLSFMISQ